MGSRKVRDFGAVFETIQESYNVGTLMFRDALHEAAAAGIGMIIREPLGNGLLTGKYSGFEYWEENHARGVRAKEQVAARIAFAQRLRELLPCEGRTLVQSLIRFALQDVPASVVIPGCKTSQHVRENMGSTNSPGLSRDQIDKIHDLFRSLQAKFGLIHPYAMNSDLGLE